MSNAPLMPKATAVWLVDNTSLTFEQIAEFCQLHVLEVKGIADGDVAHGIKGMDPIAAGQLTRDEIKRAQADTSYRLALAKPKVDIPIVKTKKGPKYTPVSRRQDRPNAILWLLRNHAELKDSQIMRLVGTTKPTIQSIRDRTHWNSPNLQPADPVTLGLCTQIDLDREVRVAAKRVEREQLAAGVVVEEGGTLLPAEDTAGVEAETAADAPIPPGAGPVEPEPTEVAEETQHTVESVFAGSQTEPADSPADEEPEEEDATADSVFAKLKELKTQD